MIKHTTTTTTSMAIITIDTDDAMMISIIERNSLELLLWSVEISPV